MHSTYHILKELNQLLKDKSTYTPTEYQYKLTILKEKVEQLLLSETNNKITQEELRQIIQQYKNLISI